MFGIILLRKASGVEKCGFEMIYYSWIYRQFVTCDPLHGCVGFLKITDT